jgi:hypothetical protein
MSPLYYRATKDFTFGGVSVRKGEPVPCHRKPWSTLLNFGHMYVEPVADPERSPQVSDVSASEPRDGAR